MFRFTTGLEKNPTLPWSGERTCCWRCSAPADVRRKASAEVAASARIVAASAAAESTPSAGGASGASAAAAAAAAAARAAWHAAGVSALSWTLALPPPETHFDNLSSCGVSTDHSSLQNIRTNQPQSVRHWVYQHRELGAPLSSRLLLPSSQEEEGPSWL